MLNNRELASAILVGAFVLLGLLVRDVRKMIPSLARTAFGWRLSLFWLGYAGLIFGVTIVAHRLGLRYAGSTKDAIVWSIVVGLPMLFRMDQIRRNPGLFARTVREAVGLTAVVEFFVNVYVFPLG